MATADLEVRQEWSGTEKLAWGGGALLIVLFAIWWAAWFPGVIGIESLNQLRDVRGFDFTTVDPPIHSFLVWVFSLGGRWAGLFTLVQAAALAGLLGLVAARLTRLGMPALAAIVTVWLVGLLPAVGLSTVALWSEVTLAIVCVWLFSELLALVADGDAFWDDGRGALRLGLPLGAVASFGIGGVIAAAFVGTGVMSRRYRGGERTGRQMLAIGLAGIAVGWLLLPLALGADRQWGGLPQALVPAVASAITHHGADFRSDELAYLATIAPIEVWEDAYECDDGDLLLRDRQFEVAAIRSDPLRFARVAGEAIARHPLTALGQRGCAAVALLSPTTPGDSAFSLPPYTLPPNDLNVRREPVWFGALTATKAVLIRSQQPDRLWLWWRPALPLAAAATVYGGLVARRRSAVLPAMLLIGLVAALLLTRPIPAFRYTFPVYLIAWLSVPLAWFVFTSPSPSRGRGIEGEGVSRFGPSRPPSPPHSHGEGGGVSTPPEPPPARQES